MWRRDEPHQPRGGRAVNGAMKGACKIIGRLLLGLVLTAMTGWGVLALYYSDLESPGVRATLAAAFGLFGLAALAGFVVQRWRRRAVAGFLVGFALLVGWWSGIEPSNERDWKPEVAVLPYATIDGDLITVHNVRNFDYRTETDFTPRYYDKTYDLRHLDSMDLIASYWAGDAIAHIFLSFGFAGKDYLAISIERRDERGEGYSTIKGLFKQYELFYNVSDERDVIRVRTNYRQDPPEDVYLYRSHGPVENGRRLFLEYMREINALRERPEFYNTLTANCTGNIWLHARVNPRRVPFSWKILLSGYVPEYLYEMGRLDTSLPFAKLKQQSRINERARAADKAADFSQWIRQGLPMPGPLSGAARR